MAEIKNIIPPRVHLDSLCDNKETKEVSKAGYTEGVYADTPANRKLGRVGMSYKQVKKMEEAKEKAAAEAAQKGNKGGNSSPKGFGGDDKGDSKSSLSSSSKKSSKSSDKENKKDSNKNSSKEKEKNNSKKEKKESKTLSKFKTLAQDTAKNFDDLLDLVDPLVSKQLIKFTAEGYAKNVSRPFGMAIAGLGLVGRAALAYKTSVVLLPLSAALALCKVKVDSDKVFKTINNAIKDIKDKGLKQTITEKINKIKGNIDKMIDKVKPSLDKSVQKSLDKKEEIIKKGDEEPGIIKMTEEIHDGLKELKEKHGIQEAYTLGFPIGKGKKRDIITMYASKNKNGNISYFDSHEDCMKNKNGMNSEQFKQHIIKRAMNGDFETR